MSMMDKLLMIDDEIFAVGQMKKYLYVLMLTIGLCSVGIWYKYHAPNIILLFIFVAIFSIYVWSIIVFATWTAMQTNVIRALRLTIQACLSNEFVESIAEHAKEAKASELGCTDVDIARATVLSAFLCTTNSVMAAIHDKTPIESMNKGCKEE